MGLIKKLYRASDLRKSRLHDEKGHLVDFAGLCYAPIAIGTGLLRKFFNRRPKMPWISYRAIKKLDQLIQPDWQVIEFGSGSSTAWIAKRCGFLYSIEDHEQWHQFVSDQLKSQGISNIKYEFRIEDEYTDLSSIEEIGRASWRERVGVEGV